MATFVPKIIEIVMKIEESSNRFTWGGMILANLARTSEGELKKQSMDAVIQLLEDPDRPKTFEPALLSQVLQYFLY